MFAYDIKNQLSSTSERLIQFSEALIILYMTIVLSQTIDKFIVTSKEKL